MRGRIAAGLALTLIGCSTGSSSNLVDLLVTDAAPPRHFVDGLGDRCTEPVLYVTRFTTPDCPVPSGNGAALLCQDTPAPTGGCMQGASPCWQIYGSYLHADDPDAIAGHPPLAPDGGMAGYTTICATCCATDGGDIVSFADPCAAIPCNTINDCPIESCHCSNGWCN